MSDLTVYATTRTTCHCTKCKREWIKKGSTELVGDLILHPEGCPFCGIEMLRELLYVGHKIVNMGGHLNDQWLIDVKAILGEPLSKGMSEEPVGRPEILKHDTGYFDGEQYVFNAEEIKACIDWADRLEEMNEKLRKYARHKKECFQGSSFFRVIHCSCGLDALLQAEKEDERGTKTTHSG